MNYLYETIRQALALESEALAERRLDKRGARGQHGVFRRKRQADAPLRRVCIDHTQLGVHVAREDEGGRLVYAGRPYLTLAMDDHCAYPLGLVSSLEKPATAKALGSEA